MSFPLLDRKENGVDEFPLMPTNFNLPKLKRRAGENRKKKCIYYFALSSPFR